MPDLKDSDFVPWILDKFVRHGWWNAKHTSFDNISKGAPKHLKDKIVRAGESLIKDGLLVRKPTSYGLEVRLNFERKNEIFSIIEKWKLNV
ncbi:hypothetical protein HY992_00955 [Candidatus Micrarchaeota archaeon]|nr:hypothetical protein [Candidatus Micrarchaeota archaeon]